MTNIQVYDKAGSKTESIQVSFAPLEKHATTAYAVSVRRLLQSWRQGTVGHKSRGEVSLTNRKPWKQKGTGRARAGSARSPLWRKGGVIFGPDARVHQIAIPRKQRRLALRSAMQVALESGNVFCLEHTLQAPSTKEARTLMKSVGLQDTKTIVFVDFNDAATYLSLRNIPNINVVFYGQVNAYDLTDGRAWVFFKKDINLFNDMVESWK